MDPLGSTLGAVALFAPFFAACKKLRHDYRLTQTFGEDYLVVQRHIDAQYARLEQLSKRSVRDLVGHRRVNVQDENDPTMKKLISLLADMKKHSDDCTKLIHHYHGPRTAGNSAQQGESPDPTTPTSTDNHIDTDPVELSPKEAKKRHRSGIKRWVGSKNSEVPNAGKAPEYPRPETVSSVTGVRNRPSILNTTAVNEEFERQRSEAAMVQSSTPFRLRYSWVQSHKKELTEFAKALGHGNNEIESLLLPAPMEKSALLLRANALTKRLSETVGLVKRALGGLHEALAWLNAPTGIFRDRDHQQNGRLSVQLQEDSEINRRQLLQEPQVHLREESYVFNVQRQEGADPQNRANLHFVETLKNPQPELDMLLDNGSGMPELHDLSLPFVSEEGIETLGFFRTPSCRYNIHVLFRDNSKRFNSPLHLADIVSSSDYRDHMNPTQIVQLVRLVMKSHLCFSSVRDTLDINPRLTHFRYFCSDDEKARGWDIEKPLVLRPWLSFGFGSPPRRYNLGEEQGIQTIYNPSMIELGLVLYQICAGEVINYGAGASVAKAKTTALKGLNKIDNAVGATMTEIVQVLLQPRSLVAAGENVGEHEETEYILNAITTLVTYEENIEDTMTDAEREAPPPPLPSAPEGSATSDLTVFQAVGGASDNGRRDLG